jgi:hypothetical protein
MDAGKTLVIGWLVGSFLLLPLGAYIRQTLRFTQFRNLRHSVRLLGRVIITSQGRHLTQTQNKHKQTSMPRVGFERTISAFERVKTVHTLGRAATVFGG